MKYFYFICSLVICRKADKDNLVQDTCIYSTCLKQGESVHVRSVVNAKRLRACVHQTFSWRCRIILLCLTLHKTVWTAATTTLAGVSGDQRVRREFRRALPGGPVLGWRIGEGEVQGKVCEGGEHCRAVDGEAIQFTVWLYPLSSE